MDTKREFTEAIKTGREIEFMCYDQHYFASRHNDRDWYIYHEETKHEQHFNSSDEMIKNARLQNKNINHLWEKIKIDYIL